MTFPGLVILILKIAVMAVTVLLAASLLVLWRGRQRLHGAINKIFFALTLTALVGLEVLVRLIDPDVFSEHFERHGARTALNVHLAFSLPSAALLLAMLVTGVRHQRKVHIGLGILFLVLWTGTFITGVFYLPHASP